MQQYTVICSSHSTVFVNKVIIAETWYGEICNLVNRSVRHNSYITLAHYR